jgi:hypothetical protein
MPLALKQNPQRFQHIALIIGYQNPAHRLTLNSQSGVLSQCLHANELLKDNFIKLCNFMAFESE